MRVLQVVTHMNRGGLETMLMNYYRHIDRSNVQFDFLVHRYERAAYDDEIEELGGMIYRLPRLNPFSRSYLKQLDQFFQEHPYQIVHSHLDCMAGIPLKYAKKNGVPVCIAHAHSSSQTKDGKYPLKLFFKNNIPKYSDFRFACGKEAGIWMFGDARFDILKNAIPSKMYCFDQKTAMEVREEFGIPDDTLLIGHVGRFCVPKNHSFILMIFQSILAKRNTAKLLLAGDGELRQMIEKKAEELGISEHIIFAGIRSDVARLLQAMDVFLFPSLYEGLPLAIVEAQAAGLPCLISDKVPMECKITDLVQQIPLSESPECWAETAMEAATQKRRNTFEEIRRAGFDVSSNAAKLQEYYLNAVEET